MRLAQQWRFLWDRIDELEPDQRTIFIMVEMHKVPQREVAAELQIPLTTVESKLRDARRKLRDAVRLAHARGELPAIMPLLGEGWKAIEAFVQRIRGSAHRAWGVLRAGAIACLPGFVPLGPASLPAHSVELSPAPSVSAPSEMESSASAALPPSEVSPTLPEADADASTCGAASRSYETAGPSLETELARGQPEQSAIAARHASPRVRAPIAPATDQAYREQLLIDGARNALYVGNIDLALAELERHKRLYPDGYLAHIREELLRQIHELTGKGSPNSLPSEASRSARGSAP